MNRASPFKPRRRRSSAVRATLALKVAEVGRAEATWAEADAEVVRCEVRFARRKRSKNAVAIVRTAAAAELAAARLNAAFAHAVHLLAKTSLSYAKLSSASSISSNICRNCGTGDTSQWRVGPEGKNTLCNGCGIRWKRRGDPGLKLPNGATSPANCEDDDTDSVDEE